VALAATALASLPLQGSRADDYFMPPAAGQGAGQRGPARPRPAPSVRPSLPPPIMPQAQQQPEQSEPPRPQLQVNLPPMPELPPVPKGTEPPTPRIGVLGVPDVMRVSTAAQEVERVLGGRRQKLNEDAQKEQAAWRGSLSAEQIRAKERELQERITNAQRTFRERDRVIQDAAQYSLAQIERVLVAVIRQVAESRGMNLVLHRQQVALNANEFDLTDQVTQQLNKVLPAVLIPPDGVSPAAMAQAPTPPAPAAGGQTANAQPAPPNPPTAPPAKLPTAPVRH
jgi:Skp family chaperone for outer membrane proteins